MKCLYREKTEAAKTAPRCYSKPRVSCALIVPNTKHWPAWKDCSATGRVTEAGWGRLMTRPPGGVWLWDEIEKAHPELVQLFLQMADEGRVTLACGETLDLRNIYLIVTSNLGSAEIIGRRLQSREGSVPIRIPKRN